MEELEQVSSDDKIDKLEFAMSAYIQVDCPLVHRFTPGLYTREIFMPAGSMITSLIHNTTHPFFILKGKVSVFSENDGEQLLEAPYSGITRPGTRRVLYVHEDTVWTTLHPLVMITGEENNFSEEDKLKVISEIESIIIIPHENYLLGGIVKNNIVYKNTLDG